MCAVVGGSTGIRIPAWTRLKLNTVDDRTTTLEMTNPAQMGHFS